MRKIRTDLIEKELLDNSRLGFDFKQTKLSNSILDSLFNKYYIIEMCENFYYDMHLERMIGYLEACILFGFIILFRT